MGPMAGIASQIGSVGPMPSTEAMPSTERHAFQPSSKSEDRQGEGRAISEGAARPAGAMQAKKPAAWDRHDVSLIALAPRDGQRICQRERRCAARPSGATKERAEADARRVRLEAVRTEDEARPRPRPRRKDMAADNAGSMGGQRGAGMKRG